MTVTKSPSVIDAQLYNLDDPLAFTPEEPRYSLTALLPYLYSLIDHQVITSQHYYYNFLVLGLQSGQLAVFYKDTLITKTVPEIDEQYAVTKVRVLSFEVPILSLVVGNSYGTVYAVYVDVSVFDYDQNIFRTPIVCSAIPDTLNALDFYYGQLALGYNSGRVFLAQMPPKQSVQKIHYPQQLQGAEILDLKFVKNYLLFINRKELVIFDAVKRQIFTRQYFSDIVTACITVDGDLCYVAVNDLVVIYLFHGPKCDMSGSPLSVAVSTALLQTTNVQFNANTQKSDITENLATFNNYASADSAEWDASYAVPDSAKLQNIKKAQQSILSNAAVEEISRFQVQDPPILIQALLPCGENLMLIGVSEPELVRYSFYEQTEQGTAEYYNSWTAFNSLRYKYSHTEQNEYCVHMMCYDIFGTEVFGNMLPVQQVQTEGIKYEHGKVTPVVAFQQACETPYNGLPAYFVTTQETVYILVPATIQDHIRYMLANNYAEKAFLAALLFEGRSDSDLLKGLNFYAYYYKNKIRPLVSSYEMYSLSFYYNFRAGIYDLSQQEEDAAKDATSEADRYDYDPFSDIFGLTNQYEPEYKQEDDVYQELPARESNKHYCVLSLPDRLNFYTVFLRVTNGLLSRNAARKACFILEQLIGESDPLWTTLALRFGMSSSFKDIVKMLPLPEVEPRLGLISLTLAHSFDSTTRLLLRWGMESFPRQLLPILEYFQRQRPQSPELHAGYAAIYLMLREHPRALEHIVYGSCSESKVYEIYYQFVDDLLTKGVFDQSAVQGRYLQIVIDNQFQKDLVAAADVLFVLNIYQSARLFTRIAAAGDFIADIFAVLTLGAAKRALGVHASQQLTKSDFQGDMRNLRSVLLYYLCVYQDDNGKFIRPNLDIVLPIYQFLAQLLRYKDQFVLNCFPDSGASLQDFLLYYAPYFEPEQLQMYLQICQQSSYLQTLYICEYFTDIDTFLRFVVQFQSRDHKTILPEQQIAFLQQALRIALGAGAVQNAIEFIRRLQEAYSSNPQQARILRQARLWQFLTKHLYSGRGVVELLDLIAKESVPVDVQEVIDMLGIDGDQKVQLGEVLFRLVDSLRIMYNLQLECASLVKNDCISLRARLFKEAYRAVFVRYCECKFCGDLVLYQEDSQKNKTRNSDFIAFQCGHFWHFECLEKCEAEMKDKGVVWHGEGEMVCPVCAQRVI